MGGCDFFRAVTSVTFRTRLLRMLSLLIVGGLVLPESSRPAEDAEPTAADQLYRRYCASCHGVDGRGGGPVAPALSPRPPDLTRQRSSVPDLMRTIDGRRTVRAHGTSAMPVWGEVFEESLIGTPHRRRIALLQVQALAEYVQALQGDKRAP
jgi:mono/diheme cytochrome c family protein